MDHLLSEETAPPEGAGEGGTPLGARGIRKGAATGSQEHRPLQIFLHIPSGPRKRPKRGARAPEAEEWTSPAGGIAQLVERQLCKLDAAGSSPAASTTGV